MSGDHRVEVEGEQAGQGGRPLGGAAAVGVVPERREGAAVETPAVDEEVAGVDGAQVGEVDDRVAVGVAASEVVGLRLGAAQEDRGLVGERQPRGAGLAVTDDVGAGVAVGDDLGRPHEVGVAAGVVAVVVGVQHVLDGLVGDAGDLGGDEVETVGELVVDEDDAVPGHADGDVAAGLPAVESGNDVEAVLHLPYLQPRLLLGGERGALPPGREREAGAEDENRRRQAESVSCAHGDASSESGPRRWPARRVQNAAGSLTP